MKLKPLLRDALIGFLLISAVLLVYRFPVSKSNRDTERAAAANSLPTLLASYDIPGSIDPQDIAIVGNYLYLVTANTGSPAPEFYIFDTFNPQQPVLKGALNLGTTANKLFISGNYAYIATNNDLGEFTVIDTANKNAPAGYTIYNLPGKQNAIALYAVNNRAYLGTASGNFYVLNIASLSSITLEGSFFVGSRINDIFVKDNKAYLATNSIGKGLEVLNVQNSSSITEESSFSLGGVGGNAVDYFNGNLFVVANDNKLSPDFYVFDIMKSPPVLVSSLDLGSNNADVKVFNSKAYVATKGDSPELKIVDITSPANPVLYSSYFDPYSKGNAVALDPRYIYVASNNNVKELQIIDPGYPISHAYDINHDDIVTVLVMGDSNSQVSWDSSTSRWPERLETQFNVDENPIGFNWHIRNIAWFAMTACDYGRTYGSFELGAPKQLPYALDNFAPDLIIFAYGTNDVGLGPNLAATPAQIFQCYQDLRATAAARGVPSMIALTPHFLAPPFAYPSKNTYIDQLNALIQANIPARDVIDFVSDMLPEDYSYSSTGVTDGVHFGNLGQIKRANAAYNALVK